MPTLETPYSVLNEVMRDVLRRSGKSAKAEIELAPFNPSILGFVRAGQDVIYVNTVPLSQVPQSNLSEYFYVVILHEYLHLLGIADEREVRRITLEMVNEKFGENSFAHNLSLNLVDPRDAMLIQSWKLGRPHTYM
ncbi:hypothetical protein HA72_1356 [Metallosphaera sedula]|uniref:Uncharacterized protein n=3 Tax=Metallosphaera TaxID=41980 RepID=A4YGG2_METS5|nr:MULTISPECIES: hypothetical protein [Metallosphaera]ABP95514.1 hypothetical protein Msed_1356 [Metallosphaera sedula DSM 5348]AIM27498.1 hypothetical protein HA72_1356 [Metallosphaera sedula]AKV74367.1 hypothetical protein MsedA_1374 [Metallosphaera sedula]AKV76606.1 hypothetical protein MsedB_1376 [Metallosphaera sedula]AKV78858.1 hypothetical protein MsedC_1374 [Metallosphaera sedula]